MAEYRKKEANNARRTKWERRSCNGIERATQGKKMTAKRVRFIETEVKSMIYYCMWCHSDAYACFGDDFEAVMHIERL